MINPLWRRPSKPGKTGDMGKPKKKDLPDLSALACRTATIEVRVTPGARRNAIEEADGTLRVYVTEKAEAGRATEAVQALLATAMGVARTDLVLKRGRTSREKMFVYEGS